VMMRTRVLIVSLLTLSGCMAEAVEAVSCCCVGCSKAGCVASQTPCPDCNSSAECSIKLHAPNGGCSGGQAIQEEGVPFSRCSSVTANTAPHVLYTTGNATSAATGFDVDAVQSVAVRFNVTRASKPVSLDLWLMANGPNASMTASIRIGDAAAPKDSAKPLVASAPFRVKAVRWKPEMQTVVFRPDAGILLPSSQVHYWLVIKSSDLVGQNGVWLIGQQRAWSTTNFGGSWQRIDSPSAAPGLTLWAI